MIEGVFDRTCSGVNYYGTSFVAATYGYLSSGLTVVLQVK